MRYGVVFGRLLKAIVLLIILFAIAVNLRLVILPQHYDPFIAPDLREKPYWLTSTKLQFIDNNAQACSAALSQAGVSAVILPRTHHGEACYLENTILMNRFSVAIVKPEQSKCNIAARLYLWERNVVQPLAQKYFGQNVKEITHFGSYSCRTIRRSHNMSEHATANAFDISGFRLANGRLIGVLARFKTGGPEGKFLHGVRDGLCDYFNLTLSPDYNLDHADHFHIDMGRVRSCR